MLNPNIKKTMNSLKYKYCDRWWLNKSDWCWDGQVRRQMIDDIKLPSSVDGTVGNPLFIVTD